MRRAVLVLAMLILHADARHLSGARSKAVWLGDGPSGSQRVAGGAGAVPASGGTAQRQQGELVSKWSEAVASRMLQATVPFNSTQGPASGAGSGAPAAPIWVAKPADTSGVAEFIPLADWLLSAESQKMPFQPPTSYCPSSGPATLGCRACSLPVTQRPCKVSHGSRGSCEGVCMAGCFCNEAKKWHITFI